MADAQLPSVIGNLTPEGNLSRYLEQIKRFPMLSAEEEYTLAKDWKDKDNLEAAHKLVTSHLRLVAKIAMGYRGYGLPMGELIAEGNLGMMHAVKRFEPEKGFRLSTYAMWWIRASIQEYILRSWSLVKIGTTAAQKKLFFNLRRIKGEIKAIDDGDMAPEQVTEIAERLDVPEMEVINMNRRLGPGDHSLNATIGGENEGGEWLDWLEDDSANQEVTFAEAEEYDSRRQLLVAAMDELNAREVQIIKARRLSDTPLTLEELSQRFGVSRERIRQIEARAFEKLQLSVRNRAIKNQLIES
jgi:RNA polymerase sigma-32 factor